MDIKKVLALMIAVILWYYVYELERSEEEHIIPIDFSEKPSDLHTDFEYQNQKLLVYVSGRKKDIEKARLSLRYLRSHVDLTQANSKQLNYKIELRKNGMINQSLSRIKIKLGKEEIAIPFEKIITKKVPVVLRIKDEQNLENKILGISYKPKWVTLKGPESKVEQQEKIKTQRYRIQEKSEDFKEDLSFEKLPKSLKILKHKKVKIWVEIDPGVREEEFKGEEVEVRGLRDDLMILNGEARIKLIKYKGPFKFLKRLAKEKFKIYIVISKVKNKVGTHKFKVKAKRFEGIELIDFFPKELELKIRLKKKRKEIKEEEVKGEGEDGGGY